MTNNEEKIYSFLGLATRAGKIVSGDDSTLLELKKGKVKLVLPVQIVKQNLMGSRNLYNMLIISQ